MTHHRYLNVAVTAARNAGAIMLEHFGGELQVDETSHHDIKLRVDRLCEEEIVRTIREAFPDHAFVTEETNQHDAGAERAWIVDPLDGTVNFAYGVPHFCTSIAFRRDGGLLCGVVYDPMLEELFTAVSGAGAFLDGKALRVSRRGVLESAIASGGFAKSQLSIDTGVRDFHRMATTLHKIRLTGSAALDMAYVACGRFDAFVENDMRLWDIAAGTLLIREAGGRVAVRDLAGADQRYKVIGTNALIHEKLADLLNADLSAGKDAL